MAWRSLRSRAPEGFVEQQGRGVVDQGPGQGHPLLLAAGELSGLAAGEVGEAHDREQLVDPCGHLGLGHLAWSGGRRRRCPTRVMWGNSA